ncbi:hypothetical protein [Streptomyces scabiei]|uniref:hypothetical protein n=1 Tax=Streptomyces scabiei TaxID=1930 RepID=UPI0029AD17D7|nr:hypothetical protein [Streptomyces scabiei]MDX3521547.1 hypothetical protein [Streptomyces scabiei]
MTHANAPFTIEKRRLVEHSRTYDGTRPTLQDLTPLTYPGTPWRDPRVVIALIGPVWTTVVVIGLLTVLAGAFFGIRRPLKRRRTARAATVAA